VITRINKLLFKKTCRTIKWPNQIDKVQLKLYCNRGYNVLLKLPYFSLFICFCRSPLPILFISSPQSFLPFHYSVRHLLNVSRSFLLEWNILAARVLNMGTPDSQRTFLLMRRLYQVDYQCGVLRILNVNFRVRDARTNSTTRQMLIASWGKPEFLYIV